MKRGISLTEVLIAMGILTVGLLGVAAVFPVAGYQMQKAEIADNGNAIAQAVMSDLIASGKLNPQSWFVLTPNPTTGNPNTDPNFTFQTADGAYLKPKGPVINSFTRPLVDAISTAKKMGLAPKVTAAMLGQAYVIDPIGIAAINQIASVNNQYCYAFPASAYAVFPGRSTYYQQTKQWAPWLTSSVGGKPTALTWPIRRVTFRQPSTGYQLDRGISEASFTCQDNLAYELPQRADRPAIMKWDTVPDSSGKPMMATPKWSGDYSWIVSVVPTTMAARDGLASSPESYAYQVSVVVFHKRILPTDNIVGATGVFDAMQPERSVQARILSTSPNGGEVTLWDTGDNPTTGAFTNLKTGNWIMLCGPHPTSNDQEPRFFLNWYQVLAIEATPSDAITNPATQRIVTLRGPEWPWRPRASFAQQNSDDAKLSDDLCVGIFKGAVAVHSKTIRLESSRSTGVAPMGLTGYVEKDPNNVAF